jgi:acyl carrier protein
MPGARAARSFLRALDCRGNMGDFMTETTSEQSREWTRAEVEASLREILVDSLGVGEAEVTPSASLVRDLGAESIDFLDIGFKIQQALNVNLQTGEIRSWIMAWTSKIHPTLAEIVHRRHGVTVTADELRLLEAGGLAKVVEHVQAATSLAAGPGAADEIGREMVERLVKEFGALGFTVSQADREDLLGIMRDDLGARRLMDRTLDLLTVGALTDFICAKLGARLRGA